MTFIDLFAGAGGFSLGLHQAGLRGILAVERDPMAFATFKYNLLDNQNAFEWPEWLPQEPTDIGDLLKQYHDSIMNLRDHVDVVVGGPPCQGFSIAGRRYEHDQRNELFKEYVNFVNLVEPEVLLFENVPGFSMPFLSRGTGETSYLSLLSKKLRRMGYEEPLAKILDFSKYGVPQSRKRLILYSAREGNDTESFFERLNLRKSNHVVSVKEAISDLERSKGVVACPDSPGFFSGVYGQPRSNFQKLMQHGFTGGIPDSHRFVRHGSRVVERFDFILKTSTERNKSVGSGKMVGLGTCKRSIIPLDGGKPSPTLTSLPDDFIHYDEPRILTAREYARLQGFPDWFEFKGKYTTGGLLRKQETPRYSQIANAVPPIFSALLGAALQSI